MGNERLAPGKNTAVSHGTTKAAADQHQVPGKTTRVQGSGWGFPASHADTPAEQTNRFPESWTGTLRGGETSADPAKDKVSAPKGDEKYPAGYREKLERIRGDRINQGYTNAQRALADLRQDLKMLQVSSVPWWANMIMGIVLAQLGNAISAGADAIRNATDIPAAIKLAVPEFNGSISEAISAANDSAARWAKREAWLEATKEFRGLAAHHIEDLTKKIVDGVTRPVSTASIAGAFNSDSGAQQDKDAGLNFVQILSDEIGFRFEAIRELAPEHMNIAELTADTHAWAQRYNTYSHYFALFHELIMKYQQSNASKIGRSSKWDLDAGKHVESEVRVARLIYGPGVERYVYMDRVFDDWYKSRAEMTKEVIDVKRSDAYDSDQNALSLSETSTWTVNGEERQHAETPLRDDRVLNMVEPEFTELAIKTSKARWAKEPETFEMDWKHPIAPGVPSVHKVAP